MAITSCGCAPQIRKAVCSRMSPAIGTRRATGLTHCTVSRFWSAKAAWMTSSSLGGILAALFVVGLFAPLVAAQGMSRAKWDETLSWMTTRHNMPELSGKDRATVLDYLEKNYPARPAA